jgi:sec-independent protein translocase protein TatC
VARLRPVAFEDRLTLVEHLDELRTRIVICLLAVGVAFAVCFWQSDQLLELANKPLPDNFGKPLTIGVTEPFFTTLSVAGYSALVLALPVILYQAYAFVLPALTPREQKTIVPFLIAIPFLFIAGVVFAYFVVMPAAVSFLLNFNESDFNIQVRAKDYYGFFTTTLAACGLLFQVPIGILAVTRLGIVTPQQLAENRRYAVLVIAVVAMLLPGTDPVTMLISMAPLFVLFEGSLLVARLVGTPSDPYESELGVEPPPGEPPSGAAA